MIRPLKICYTLLATLFAAIPWTHANAQAFDLPDIPECLALIPGAIATDSTPVTLGLRMVLDGVSVEQAAEAIAIAQTSYTPLGITLSVSYDSASFSTNDGLALIEQVKQFYGGSRPAGTHLVYALTSKDLTGGTLNDSSLLGQADCIGGVSNPNNAFAVGELHPDLGAATLAHELGHLLGAHHHYANCAEALIQGGNNLCTLMFMDAGLAALPFSALNGLVVRGHAQLAASPTPPGSDNPGAEPAPQSSGGGSGGGGSLSWLALGTLLASRLHAFKRRAHR